MNNNASANIDHQNVGMMVIQMLFTKTIWCI